MIGARGRWGILIALVAALCCSIPIPALSAGGTATYSYDALGRLKQVLSPNGVTVIYALDAAGNRTSVTTIQPPSAPGTPTISSITTSTATATWTASSGSPTGYEYTLNGGASWLSVANSLTANLSGLAASTNYTFSVRAYNAYGGRGPQSSASFTTATPPPSTPTGLTATTAGNTQINLSWSASSDAGGPGLAGYYVYRNGTKIATTASTSFSDTGVAVFTTYSYQVAAYDTQGRTSAMSSAVSGSTYFTVTDSGGNVLPAASSLYSASVTVGYPHGTCCIYTWTVTEPVGSKVTAAEVRTDPPDCSGPVLILASGYELSGCVLTAEPSVYGH
jgi:YD repeat-containing protein